MVNLNGGKVTRANRSVKYQLAEHDHERVLDSVKNVQLPLSFDSKPKINSLRFHSRWI